jgi:metal-responsive CopG/Arc/MetJ family transcriptional regulator
MEQEKQQEAQKVLVSFHPEFVLKVDKHWRSQNFKNRSEYINHLVRKDMENGKEGK